MIGVLRHEAGHKEEAELQLPADATGGKNAVQAVGSTLTYGQRYVARMLLSLTSRPSEDDDGQAAGESRAERTPSPRSTPLRQAAFPAWKRANRTKLGDLSSPAFQRVIGCYGARLGRIRAQAPEAA